MANLFKFVGTDNSTSGSAINPFGSGNPLANETYVIKSILVTSEGNLLLRLQTIVLQQ